MQVDGPAAGRGVVRLGARRRPLGLHGAHSREGAVRRRRGAGCRRRGATAHHGHPVARERPRLHRRPAGPGLRRPRRRTSSAEPALRTRLPSVLPEGEKAPKKRVVARGVHAAHVRGRGSRRRRLHPDGAEVLTVVDEIEASPPRPSLASGRRARRRLRRARGARSGRRPLARRTSPSRRRRRRSPCSPRTSDPRASTSSHPAWRCGCSTKAAPATAHRCRHDRPRRGRKPHHRGRRRLPRAATALAAECDLLVSRVPASPPRSSAATSRSAVRMPRASAIVAAVAPSGHLRRARRSSTDGSVRTLTPISARPRGAGLAPARELTIDGQRRLPGARLARRARRRRAAPRHPA